MVRNKGDKNFTIAEKNLLICMIKDYEVCDLPDYTMIEILSNRLGRKIKETSYYMLKNEANKNRPSPEEWLDNFVRFGLVDFYKKRIQEVELTQKYLIELYLHETRKKESDKESNNQNKILMNQLAKTIGENSKTIAELGIGPATIAKLLTLIPRELVEGELDYVQKHFNEMDKKKKTLFWSIESDSSLSKDEDVNVQEKIDPSKAPTALLPPIDKIEKTTNRSENEQEATAQSDQRIF